jgi:hypothetical protein
MPQPRFPHRLNRDGSTDSICSVCYATIASSYDATTLAFEEYTHVCNPGRILDLARDLTPSRGTRIGAVVLH